MSLSRSLHDPTERKSITLSDRTTKNYISQGQTRLIERREPFEKTLNSFQKIKVLVEVEDVM
jgi:hypothetical protein